MHADTLQQSASIERISYTESICQDLIDGATHRIEQRDNCQTLSQLHDLDQQLEAHLDALWIGKADAEKHLLDAMKDAPSPALFFLILTLTLQARNTPRLKKLLSRIEAEPEYIPSALDAFSWLPPAITHPLIPHLLTTPSLLCQKLGLHLYSQHQIQADTSYEWAINHSNPELQILALNGIAEAGATDLVPLCMRLQASDQPDVQWAAIRASLLLGDSQASAEKMQKLALGHSPFQQPALSLLATFLPISQVQPFLSSLAKQTSDKHLLIKTSGELGDPSSIPALLRLMQDPMLSRIAAFAFCFITGLDLVEHNMEANAPEDFEAGPNDDPDDDNVDSDPDEDLPWPDRNKLIQWWEQHGSAFKAGTRYLMGKEITREHCLDVLEFGNQAQRKIAALHLKRMDPASPLFLIDAPAWRQRARLQLLRNS